MSVRVRVSQEHIDKGMSAVNGENCPIALALLDMGVEYAFVGKVCVRTDEDWWRLPLDARLFIELFDNTQGKIASPFEFDMEFWPKGDPEWFQTHDQ